MGKGHWNSDVQSREHEQSGRVLSRCQEYLR